MADSTSTLIKSLRISTITFFIVTSSLGSRPAAFVLSYECVAFAHVPVGKQTILGVEAIALFDKMNMLKIASPESGDFL